jgi:hypothetical protein
VTIAPRIEAELRAQLELARQVQLRLLPDRRCCLSDWEVAFSYESAGFVSGDYVDLIPAGDDAFYFTLGDVSGKGVAASMLMSHLHATLRTLLPSAQTLEEVVATASSTFCQSALPAQFATLVLGKADRSGTVELVNAGHNPVLLVGSSEVEVMATASLPLGMFCSTDFASVNDVSAQKTHCSSIRTGSLNQPTKPERSLNWTDSPKRSFNRGLCSLLRLWKRSNAPLFAIPMVRNQAMTAPCLRFAGHRKEFEECHTTMSCSFAQAIPHVRSWLRRS